MGFRHHYLVGEYPRPIGNDLFQWEDNEHHGLLRLQFVPIGRLSDREFYNEWEYVSGLYSTHVNVYVKGIRARIVMIDMSD